MKETTETTNTTATTVAVVRKECQAFKTRLPFEAFTLVCNAIATDKRREILNTVYCNSSGDDTVLVGTDGKRLTLITLNPDDGYNFVVGVMYDVFSYKDIITFVPSERYGTYPDYKKMLETITKCHDDDVTLILEKYDTAVVNKSKQDRNEFYGRVLFELGRAGMGRINPNFLKGLENQKLKLTTRVCNDMNHVIRIKAEALNADSYIMPYRF